MIVVDRDEPCRCCGALAARKLADGAIECVGCNLVTPDRFTAAKRSFGSGRNV